MLGYPWVLAFNNFFVETLHVICPKWWNKCAHLVQNTSKRPDVTLGVIRHISPNLRAFVIRSSSLSVGETFLNNLGDVQVTKLSLHVPIEEYIGTLHISM